MNFSVNDKPFAYIPRDSVKVLGHIIVVNVIFNGFSSHDSKVKALTEVNGGGKLPPMAGMCQTL